jgi:phosphodiesterase/alkaline phosphatase D-like protein
MCAAQIYRNFEVGKLLRLITLDTRVIGRDEQVGHPCVAVRRPRHF